MRDLGASPDWWHEFRKSTMEDAMNLLHIAIRVFVVGVCAFVTWYYLWPMIAPGIYRMLGY